MEKSFKNKITTKDNLLMKNTDNSYINDINSKNKLKCDNYEELNGILTHLNTNTKNKEKIFLFLYNNKDNVHDILYRSEEIIKIDDYYKNPKELNNIFYLSLLIKDNNEIINYSYLFNFIIELNNILTKLNEDLIIKKIFYSKFIIELINNYLQLDDNEEDYDENNIKDIQKSCETIISENIKIFEELNCNIKNVDDLIDKKCDEIYIDIIKSLIKPKKINDFEYTYKIINQLELEKIKITKDMYDELLKIFDDEIIKQYDLKSKEDLLKETNINFYYILLKYIIKDSVNIYQIRFLKKQKKTILTLFKKNEIKFYDSINDGLKKRLYFIIKNLINSEYYFIEYKLIELKEILNYYKSYLFKSKKEDIETLEDIIKNKKGESLKYLGEYDNAKNKNDRFPIIKFLFYEKKNKKIESEEDLKKNINTWFQIEKSINGKNYKKIKKSNKEYLSEYFNDKNNRKILLNIFNEDIIDYFIKQNIKKENKNNNNNNINNDNNPEKNGNPENNNNTNNIKIINNEKIQMEKQNQDEKQNSKKDQDISTKFIINKNNNEIKIKDKEKDKSPPPFAGEYKNKNDYKISSIDNSIPQNILQKSFFSFNFKGRGKEPIIDKIIYGNSSTEITYDQYKKIFGEFSDGCKKNFKKTENNYRKFNNFIEEFKQKIKNEFLSEYKLKINLLFINQNKDKDNMNNISCKYEFIEPIYSQKLSFKDDNILINGTNSNQQGLEYLISEINSKYYKEIKYEEKSSKNKKFKNKNINEMNNRKNNSGINEIQNNNESTLEKTNIQINNSIITNESREKYKKAKKENILELIKIIEKGNKYNGFIKELNNGFYIICKSDNCLNLYDNNFNNIKEISGFKESIFNVYERINRPENNNKKSEIIELITCANNSVYLIIINLKDLKTTIKGHNLSHINLNCLEMKISNCVILSQKGLFHYIDLFINKTVKQNKVSDEVFIGSIRITENILALTSNSIIPGGKDKLLFYNIKSKKLSNIIEGYSFVVSPNGLSLIEKEKNKNKILLCACKQYKSEQKNGILIINAELADNMAIRDPFFKTENFEVNCFCPIMIVDNKNKNYNNINIDEEYKKNIEIKNTEYFLVGGFDQEKGEGKIKLYKLIFSEKIIDTTIKYIQDIDIEEDEKFEGFNGPINCMIQSKITGNVIVSCYNEKIYMLTPPNLEYYIEKK